jgi:hypothetical protein
MGAELRLDLPWIPPLPQRVGELAVRRGQQNMLAYDDGIALEVHLLDPASYSSAEALTSDATRQTWPGRVLLATEIRTDPGSCSIVATLKVG